MYVRVHVLPNTKKERIIRENENTFVIAVREPAERNLANKRICNILATEFGVETRCVHILTGHHSPSKLFTIDN